MGNNTGPRPTFIAALVFGGVFSLLIGGAVGLVHGHLLGGVAITEGSMLGGCLGGLLAGRLMRRVTEGIARGLFFGAVSGGVYAWLMLDDWTGLHPLWGFLIALVGVFFGGFLLALTWIAVMKSD